MIYRPVPLLMTSGLTLNDL